MSRIYDAILQMQDDEGSLMKSLVGQSGSEVTSGHTSEPATLPSGTATSARYTVAAAAVVAPSSRIAAEPEALNGFRRVPLQIGSPSPLLPFDETHWYAGEQYRMIRTRILQHPAQPRMLVVSSASSGDGKSVSAVNLAGALSLKADSRVVLVDGDFRKPTIHSQLGIPKGPGLAEVLKGSCSMQEAVAHIEQFPNLYVLASGETTTNPAELLDSSEWRTVCSQLREQFGYIVIDSPPVGRVADYDLLQAACDAVVMVIRPDHTNRKLCFDALKTISPKKLMGVLLNCADDWFLVKQQDHYNPYYGH
jgi:capsular exopolysaccharide synthesis family protein